MSDEEKREAHALLDKFADEEVARRREEALKGREELRKLAIERKLMEAVATFRRLGNGSDPSPQQLKDIRAYIEAEFKKQEQAAAAGHERIKQIREAEAQRAIADRYNRLGGVSHTFQTAYQQAQLQAQQGMAHQAGWAPNFIGYAPPGWYVTRDPSEPTRFSMRNQRGEHQYWCNNLGDKLSDRGSRNSR